MARRHRQALIAIRNELADSCPAWALEWDRVTAGDGLLEHEMFTVQEVRDAARAVLDPIYGIVNDTLAPRHARRGKAGQ